MGWPNRKTRLLVISVNAWKILLWPFNAGLSIVVAWNSPKGISLDLIHYWRDCQLQCGYLLPDCRTCWTVKPPPVAARATGQFTHGSKLVALLLI